MTDSEMQAMVKVMVGDDRYDDIVQPYLDLAKAKVVSRLYPMTPEADWDGVDPAYHLQTCEIAVYLINKRGAEGETVHEENGTRREYESASVPNSMFRGMVPFAGVPR